jgi:tetratricopeptide (TPR) repeat protein
MVSPGSLDEARLTLRQAAEAVYEGSEVDPVVVAVEAVRAFGQDAASAEALSLLHHVQLSPRYAEERLLLAQEIVRLGARAGDSLLTLQGLCWQTVDLFLLGNPRAGQSLQEFRERATAEACEALGFISDHLGAMVLARTGRLGDAEAAAIAAFERGSAAGDPDAGAYYGAMLAALRWWQGRGSEIVELVRATSTSPRLGFNDHVYVAADAAVSAAQGDAEEAEEALTRLTEIGLGQLPESSSWLTTLALVAEAAYLLGDAKAAVEAGELLAPYAHLPVMPSLAVVCLGSAERALGLAAATEGHLDAAVHHLEAALHADRRLSSRPMAVLTEHTLAGVLGVRRAPDDERRAQVLSQRADERAKRIGMVLPAHPSWLAADQMASWKATCARKASIEPCQAGWRIEVDSRTMVVPNRVGFSYLAQLVAHPDQDVDALALASVGCSGLKQSRVPILDEQALRTYRRRAERLKGLIEDAELPSSEVRRHKEELDALTVALRQAVALGGRVRAFPDTGERARTAVRKALVRAIAAVSAAEPQLGQHLQASVTTGATCRYSPVPGWTVMVRSLTAPQDPESE